MIVTYPSVYSDTSSISSPVIGIEDILTYCKETLFKIIYEQDINPIRKDIFFCMILLLSIAYSQSMDYAEINKLFENAQIDKIEQPNRAVADNKKFMYQEIDRIKKSYSEDRWDGADAQAVSQEAIDDAKKFIKNLPDDVLTPTAVRLAADGEINFLWKLSNFKLDLGIYGDNTYSYYGKTTFGDKFNSDDKLISENLPEDILAYII